MYVGLHLSHSAEPGIGEPLSGIAAIHLVARAWRHRSVIGTGLALKIGCPGAFAGSMARTRNTMNARTLPTPSHRTVVFALAAWLSLNATTPAQATEDGVLLAAVPESAFALLHVADPVGFRSRAERNEWIKAWDALDANPALLGMGEDFEAFAKVDSAGLLELLLRIDGEALLFFGGDVAGFLSEAPLEREELAALLQGWLAEKPRVTHEIGGARVVLSTWPEVDKKTHQAGAGNRAAYLAYLEHPLALGLYSGSSKEAVLGALADSLGGLETQRRSEIVKRYLAAGGLTSRGAEAFVDFTPFISEAERALKEASQGIIPDPTGLLGLERGTSLFVSADLSPGARVDIEAQLRIPEGTLAAQLADTFEPLPATVPAELAAGSWGVSALNWNLSRFYTTARKNLEQAHGEGLEVIDAGLTAAEAISGVDPVQDVIDQLSGLFVLYFALTENGLPTESWEGLGFLAGLVDSELFLDALEAILESVTLFADNIEFEGAETLLFAEGEADGGISVMPQRTLFSPSRDILVRGIQAMSGVEGAGLGYGSKLQAAFDENAGSCAFGYTEFQRLYQLTLARAGKPLVEQSPLRDAELIMSARRTAAGFDLRWYAR